MILFTTRAAATVGSLDETTRSGKKSLDDVAVNVAISFGLILNSCWSNDIIV